MTISPISISSNLSTTAYAVVSLINETKLIKTLLKKRSIRSSSSNNEIVDDINKSHHHNNKKKLKQQQQRRHVRFFADNSDYDDTTSSTTKRHNNHCHNNNIIRRRSIAATTAGGATSSSSSSPSYPSYVLTDDLKSKMWYSSKEMKQFLVDCHRYGRPKYYEQILIDALFEGNDDDDNDNDDNDKFTKEAKRRILNSSSDYWRYDQTRGLELWGSKVATQRRRNHSKIVLDLCKDPSSTNVVVSDDFLSSISSISSSQSSKVAQIFAQLDSMKDDDEDDEDDHEDYTNDFDIEVGRSSTSSCFNNNKAAASAANAKDKRKKYMMIPLINAKAA